jgi:hypothetical protein
MVSEKLQEVNQIVAVGSVDGVLTAAALYRVIGRKDTGLVFTQAFTVDKLDISGWLPERNVAFVDLAVNNRDAEMTKAFVERLEVAGHKVVAVIDEHNQAAWKGVLESFEGLLIEPQSQEEGIFRSSGAVLKAALDEEADAYTLELLNAADAGDRMDFTTHFGGIVNQAVKSAITDDTRRVYLARYLAFNREPDAMIQGWMHEYEELLANHQGVLDAQQDLRDGIVRVVTTGRKVDMTTLMNTIYRQAGVRVVVLEGMAFNKAAGGQTLQISFGTKDETLDLMAAIKATGVTPLGGFPQKVNVEPADEATAVAAVRMLLAPPMREGE